MKLHELVRANLEDKRCVHVNSLYTTKKEEEAKLIKPNFEVDMCHSSFPLNSDSSTNIKRKR